MLLNFDEIKKQTTFDLTLTMNLISFAKVPYPQPYEVVKHVPVHTKEYVKELVHVPAPYPGKNRLTFSKKKCLTFVILNSWKESSLYRSRPRWTPIPR